MKRLVAAIIVSALIVCMAGAGLAQHIDLLGTRYEESVDYLEDLGVVAGYPDGTFRPEGLISRAETTKIITLMRFGSTALVDLLRGASPFGDVPGDHWASGYITLARNAGIVNGYPDGTFRPDALVSYAEFAKMLVEAAGLAPLAGLAWPANYVAASQAAGILGEVPAFSGNEPATRGDCAIMAAYTVHEVKSPATGKTLGQSVFGESAVAALTIIPATENVAIGEAVSFTVNAVDAGGAAIAVSPAYGTSDASKSVVSATGLFVASAPGSYAVTATVDSLSAIATVTVFGPAKGLRAVPNRTTVVANGESTVDVTVEVVDANGFIVETDQTTSVEVGYADDGNNGAVELPIATARTVSDGKVAFQFAATNVADRTDFLTFRATDLTSGHAELASLDPVASSITVMAAPANVTSNTQTATTVTAKVLDQAGVLLNWGVHSLKFEIAGPGTFTDTGSTAARSVPTLGGMAEQLVYSIQAEPGTIVVTVSSEGVSSGSVGIGSHVAGAARTLKIEALDGTIKAGTGAGAEADKARFRVVLVDAQGRPTTHDADVGLEIDLADGHGLWERGLDYGGIPVIPAGLTTSAVLEIVDDDAIAGTHAIRVRDVALEFAAATFDVTVAPGDPCALAADPGPSDVPVKLAISDPRATVTVRLRDAAGNDVAKPNVEVACTWLDLHPTGLAYVNGTGMTPGAPGVAVKTDSSGTAVFNITAQAYADDWHEFQFSATGLVAVNSAQFLISDSFAAGVDLSFRSGAGPNAPIVSRVAADPLEYAYIHVNVKDGSGNPLAGDRVEISFSDEGRSLLPFGAGAVLVGDCVCVELYGHGHVKLIEANTGSDGRVVVAFQGELAATFTVAARAVQVAPPLAAARSFRTVKGVEFRGFGVEAADGSAAEFRYVSGNTPMALRIFAIDNGGNVIPVPREDGVWLGKTEEGTEFWTLEALWEDVAIWELRDSPEGGAVAKTRIGPGETYKTVYVVFSADVENVRFQCTD